MYIFLNTESQSMSTDLNNPSPVEQINVKRGDNANFDCFTILNFGNPYELDASVILTDFRLTAKVPGALGADDFIISALTFTKTGTGTSTFYRLAPSLDTTALNDLFAEGGVIATPATAVARLALTGLAVGNIVRQVDTSVYYQVLNASLLAFDVGTATPGWTITETREAYVDLAAEFEYVLDGLQVSYPTFTLRVYDDVSKGNESPGTTPVFPSFPNPSAMASTYIAAFFQ
jgi:hypothetical protein